MLIYNVVIIFYWTIMYGNNSHMCQLCLVLLVQTVPCTINYNY